MPNFRTETLEHINSVNVPIKCATIHEDNWVEASNYIYILKCMPTSEQILAFIEFLDKAYDSGYGTQRFSGTIWYTDGTWSTRLEYDGSEWWEHFKCPEIPEELQCPDS